jgi:hypothetical protein
MCPLIYGASVAGKPHSNTRLNRVVAQGVAFSPQVFAWLSSETTTIGWRDGAVAGVLLLIVGKGFAQVRFCIAKQDWQKRRSKSRKIPRKPLRTGAAIVLGLRPGSQRC